MLPIACGAMVLALAMPDLSAATPYDYIAVGDPLESELRVLDLLDSDALRGRIRLPHLFMRPVQPIELEGLGNPPESTDVIRRISIARIERALGRDRAPLFAPHPLFVSTPRLLEYGSEAQLLELSAGAEGRAEWDRHDQRLLSGSGLEGRVALGLDRLVAFSHYVIGRIDNAHIFADPILPNNDVIALTEETYLSYTEERGLWGAQFGRSRWHWGPGEEGSLVLSKTSASLTGLAFRVHLSALRADAIALSATLRPAAGEQLAAHRVEWQPADGLRIAVTEAARYRSQGWSPLYFMGAIPYVMVQRLLVQAEPDSLSAYRNNIITAFDAGWRVAEGTRLYGELLIDDLHVRSGKTPNKLAYQLGWEGVGSLGGSRVGWGGEFTRITRFVYTSWFGRDYQSLGRPLGFPIAPDMRHVRVRTTWDPGPDWQLQLLATHTDKGENELDEPFIPHSPRVDAFKFEGVVETTREIEARARWWPASGVDLAIGGGYRWVENPSHVLGGKTQSPTASIEVRLAR